MTLFALRVSLLCYRLGLNYIWFSLYWTQWCSFSNLYPTPPHPFLHLFAHESFHPLIHTSIISFHMSNSSTSFHPLSFHLIHLFPSIHLIHLFPSIYPSI